MQSLSFLLVCFMMACAGMCAQESIRSEALLRVVRSTEPPSPESLLEPFLFASALAKAVGSAGPPSGGSRRVARQANRMSREELRKRIERLIEQRDAMQKLNAEREREAAAARERAQYQHTSQRQHNVYTRSVNNELTRQQQQQRAEWQRQEQARREEEARNLDTQQQTFYLSVCYWYHLHPPGSQ